MKIRILSIACACVGLLWGTVRADGPLNSREMRRERRKSRRKTVQKVQEARTIAETQRTQARLAAAAEGVSGKLEDRKLKSSRLDYNLAKRFRWLFKLEKEKLGKERTLRAATEAEERRARAREAARRREWLLRRKRKIDLTTLFDW